LATSTINELKKVIEEINKENEAYWFENFEDQVYTQVFKKEKEKKVIEEMHRFKVLFLHILKVEILNKKY
jgi:hypothetical protein